MTATEALERADYIASIASRADVDKRTVVKCLRGESPLSTIWIAVQHAAEAMGIKDVPPPAPRPPRPPRPCPACAAKDRELAALRARVAELEAATQAPAPAPVPSAEPERQEARYPVTPSSDPTCEHIGEGPSRPVPASRVVRVQSTRPRCHVTLEHDGVDLLAVATPAEAAG